MLNPKVLLGAMSVCILTSLTIAPSAALAAELPTGDGTSIEAVGEGGGVTAEATQSHGGSPETINWRDDQVSYGRPWSGPAKPPRQEYLQSGTTIDGVYELCKSQRIVRDRCEALPAVPAPEDPTPEEPATPGTPVITISDVANFAPTDTLIIGEPSNAGVADLPTNFIAPATTQTVSGTLFDIPIQVRFTPTTFDFNYGDGDTLTTNTGGASWDTLGVPQFTPTDTTHTYTERGTYTASVTIRYTAEVTINGTTWIPLDGEITRTSPPQNIRIYEAHTALVKYTCTEDPNGIGC